MRLQGHRNVSGAVKSPVLRCFVSPLMNGFHANGEVYSCTNTHALMLCPTIDRTGDEEEVRVYLSLSDGQVDPSQDCVAGLCYLRLQILHLEQHFSSAECDHTATQPLPLSEGMDTAQKNSGTENSKTVTEQAVRA